MPAIAVRRVSICVLMLLAGCIPAREPARPPAPDSITPSAELPETDPAMIEPVHSTEPGPDDPTAESEFTTTASGLKYRILRSGDDRKPSAVSTVNCHYRGWLDDGTQFDSSYSRGESTTFPLSGVIAGWTEGLQLIGVGGKIELEIPYALGYGAAGKPPAIPREATLHFIVELFDVR